MRNSIFYQPLAVIMAILMLPPFTSITGTSATSLAEAQSFTGCAPVSSRIIQNIGGLCDSNFAVPSAILQQFEVETVSAWLTIHGLPQSARSMIYELGRSDLRSELRGYMLARLLEIIARPATQRTANEQALYTGFQKKV